MPLALAVLASALREGQCGDDPLTQWEVLKGARVGTTGRDYRGLLYGGGVFVAFGSTPVQPIQYSEDLITWQTGYDASLSSMVYAEGSFLGLAGNGAFYRSTDGQGWVPGSVSPSQPVNALAYGRRAYVVAGGWFVRRPVGRSQDLEVWTWAGVESQSAPELIAFGKNRFVMSTLFDLLSSSDGLAWRTTYEHTVSKDDNLRDVAYGQGRFVLAGADAKGLNHALVMTSDDGVIWTKHPGVGLAPQRRVTYGNGLFVGTGEAGLIVTSPDGIDWTRRSVNTTEGLSGVTFAKGRFVILGENGSVIRSAVLPPHVATPRFRPTETVRLEDGAMLLTVEAPYGQRVWVEASEDLVRWQLIASDPCDKGEFEVYDERAKHFGHRFYRAVQGMPSAGWEPLDDWRLGSAPSAPPVYPFYRAAYGRGTFVLRGASMCSSTNGSDWQPTITNFYSGELRYTGDKFFAYHQVQYYYYSSNGYDWTLGGLDGSPAWSFYGLSQVVWWRGQYLACIVPHIRDFPQDRRGVEEPRRSADGVRWEVDPGGWVCGVPGPPLLVANGLAVGIGKNKDQLRVRTEEGAWLVLSNADWPVLEGITYGNGTFVVAGWRADGDMTQGQVLTSRDGLQWSRWATPADNRLLAVCYGNKTFVACGQDGALLSSTDGTNWTERVPPLRSDFGAGTFGQGRFVVGGGAVLYSGVTPPAVAVVRVVPEWSRRLADGAQLLTLEGPYGKVVMVESSLDGAAWKVIATDPCDRGEFEVYDEEAMDGKPRFYRARQAVP